MTPVSRLSIFLSFFAVISCAAYSQNNQERKIDSLQKCFALEKIPYRKAYFLTQIGEAFYFDHPDSACAYYNRSLQLLYNLAARSTKPLADSAVRYQAFPLGCIAYDFAVKGELDSSLFYYQQALAIDKKLGTSAEIATGYTNVGTIYKRMNLVGRAMDYFQQSLKITEKSGDDDVSAQTLNAIGVLSRSTGDMESAKKYFGRAMAYYEKTGNKAGIANLANTIATILENENKLDEAFAFFSKSLSLVEELHFTEGKAFVLNNLGKYYTMRGENKKAIECFEQSLAIREQLGQLPEMTLSMKNLADTYMNMGDAAAAQRYIHRLKKLLPEIGVLAIKKEILFLLFRFARNQKDYRAAFDYFEEYNKAKDSLAGQEQKKDFLKKQLQYEYEKKASADSLKNAATQKVKDAQLAAQKATLTQEKFQRYSLVVGLSLVVCGLLFAISRFRVTQKQKKIIEEQKLKVDEAFEKLHEKNKEVMDSIYYARRIQRALITSEKYIERTLLKLNNK